MRARPRHGQQGRHRLAGAAALGAGLAAVGALGARAVRRRDRRRSEALWARLARFGSALPARFEPAMIEGLPAPVQRYFHYAIAPGTPLRLVAEIDMVGRLGLGDRTTPRYMPMRAREILAPPHGFVWIATLGSGLGRISGSDAYADGEAWTRFWLLDTVPIVRPAATPDLVRSAAARAIAEALWVPASLLPLNGVVWTPIDDDRARAVFQDCGDSFALDLSVAEDGRPLAVAMQRWSNVNPERVYRWQPFGATVAAVERFGGYTVPVRLEAGNHFGTEAYFPFFQATVTAIRYG